MALPKLRPRNLRWLKIIHLIAVSCWIGGAVALLMLYFLKESVTDGAALYGINQASHHVDTAPATHEREPRAMIDPARRHHDHRLL